MALAGPGFELSEIWIYPVKSLRGLSLYESALDARGLRHDRHWMIVDDQGQFLTQRQLPRMCLLGTALDARSLYIFSSPEQQIQIPLSADAGRMNVKVWNDTVEAVRCGDAYDRWLGDFLGVSCHLVRFPDHARRQVDPKYAKPADLTGFSDGFPLLLISQSSLDELNNRLNANLPMNRFRPNLVVTGTTAFAEDQWNVIQVGDLTMRVVKPCSRCIITTINPDTAEKSPEPLQTLASYRNQGNQVMFGQNVIHDQIGLISCGDSVVPRGTIEAEIG
ncbi:MAG: MOSC domain-containing protein [Thiotrichales bacterium]